MASPEYRHMAIHELKMLERRYLEPPAPGSCGLRPAAWTYNIIMVKPMVYTATVNVHDILTCKHGTLLPTALDEDQYLESVEQDYMGVLLII